MIDDRTLPDHEDDGDRALREVLRRQAAPTEACAALQQRVLAQWRQRHRPQAQSALPLRSGNALLLGTARRRQLLVSGALALALAAALATWWLRPDPTLGELLQPDVLSQMGMGEL